jgi:hypothetical protein
VEIFANDTGNKLFTGVNNTSEKLSRMSLLLVINCRSTTPAIVHCNSHQFHVTGDYFIGGDNDTGDN